MMTLRSVSELARPAVHEVAWASCRAVPKPVRANAAAYRPKGGAQAWIAKATRWTTAPAAMTLPRPKRLPSQGLMVPPKMKPRNAARNSSEETM